ncbi:hypothetical protein [Nostoc sp.]|uniref:hypothetical protein n=1 Tax=Nostoc sp. TaxID=1180 RepID=UPI002FF66A25
MTEQLLDALNQLTLAQNSLAQATGKATPGSVSLIVLQLVLTDLQHQFQTIQRVLEHNSIK